MENITYVKVSKEKFFEAIRLAEQKGLTSINMGGGFMGCVFFYGDKNKYPNNDSIIGMVNTEVSRYSLLDIFVENVYG